MTSVKSIAFVVHEQAAKKIIQANNVETDFLELLENSPWGSRPNSTTRLTLANLKAVQSLTNDFDINFIAADKFTEVMAQELKKYDLVVVNSIASAPSIRFTADLLKYKRKQNGEFPKIIVGTEATWAAQIANGNITEDEYDLIYFGDGLLRHTARTDREIYTRPDVHKAAIQEFELGIDQSLFRNTTEPNKRKTITFVKAPEGRKTKNNESVDRIIDLLEQDERFNEFNIKVVEPPYAITDYWQILAETSYLIFTSLGETFSYALNDAKALGAVTFLPRQMYYSTVGRRFAVDGYPEIGIKYDGIDEIPSRILSIEGSSGDWQRASKESRDSCLDRFGLEKVTRNWRALFNGENLNDKSLYLVAQEDALSFDKIADNAALNSCDFAMSLQNAGTSELIGKLSEYHQDTNVMMLAYYITSSETGLHRYIDISDGLVLANSSVPVEREDWAQSEAFLQLICRTNKIGRIVTTRKTLEVAGNSLSKLSMFTGVNEGVKSIPIETAEC
ncbi:hypothetical protein ACTXN6_13790 [Corynebacterium casei]|uniref:hypothetical protein n=1 Tax=Corynebacterium casei TaxID=160386 RepID=UPI003FD5BE64